MKPLKFDEATVELAKPASMTDEECSSLHIYQSETGECISLWSTSFWERLKFLFHGKLWIGVLSGKTQPPVWLDMTKTVFIEDKKTLKDNIDELSKAIKNLKDEVKKFFSVSAEKLIKYLETPKHRFIFMLPQTAVWVTNVLVALIDYLFDGEVHSYAFPISVITGALVIFSALVIEVTDYKRKD